MSKLLLKILNAFDRSPVTIQINNSSMAATDTNVNIVISITNKSKNEVLITKVVTKINPTFITSDPNWDGSIIIGEASAPLNLKLQPGQISETLTLPNRIDLNAIPAQYKDSKERTCLIYLYDNTRAIAESSCFIEVI